MIRSLLLRAALLGVLLVLIPLLDLLSLGTRNREPTDSLASRPAPEQTGPLSLSRIIENRQRGRAMQALFQVELLAEGTGWTPDLRRLAGDLWREIGDLSTAVSFWEAAASLEEADAGLARELAAAYIELQRWPNAAGALRRLVELSPDDLWAQYHLGLILAAFDPREAATHLGLAAISPDYAAVAAAVRSVITENPGEPLLAMRVGITLAEQELWPYAELAFQQAAAISPAGEALAYVGLSRDWQGKDGGAWIEQAVALDPQNPRVRYLQGLHLRALGAYQGSLDALLMAAALDPENPAFSADVGTAYSLLGNLTEAERWLKTAVALSGGAAEFQGLLALFYTEQAPALTAEGLAALDEAVRSLPDDPDAIAGYGWALHVMGQTDRGLAEIETALQIAPDNARALFYKASIWLENGRLDDAVPLLEEVAVSASSFADQAQRLLASLGR